MDENKLLIEQFENVLYKLDDYIEQSDYVAPLYINNLTLPKNFSIVARDANHVSIFNAQGLLIGNVVLYSKSEIKVANETSLYVKYVYYYGDNNEIYFDYYDLNGKKRVSYRLNSNIAEVYNNDILPRFIYIVE